MIQKRDSLLQFQLSVTETLFSQYETSILLHTAICVALHMAEYA